MSELVSRSVAKTSLATGRQSMWWSSLGCLRPMMRPFFTVTVLLFPRAMQEVQAYCVSVCLLNLYVYPALRSLLIINKRAFKRPLEYCASPKSILNDDNQSYFSAFYIKASLAIKTPHPSWDHPEQYLTVLTLCCQLYLFSRLRSKWIVWIVPQFQCQ